MVWDCLIAWVIVVFTMVGWSMGLVRSWTVPISMAVATFIAQHIYVDLATLLVETTHLEPTLSVFLGYVFTWLWLVEFGCAFLADIVRVSDSNPPVISKLGGGAIGFSKGCAAFVLATMVACAQNKVPEPPEPCWANLWIIQAASDSFLLPRFHLVASRLDQPIGKYVLSSSAPRVQTKFDLGGDPFGPLKKKEERKGFEFIQSWKKFQQDLGSW